LLGLSKQRQRLRLRKLTPVVDTDLRALEARQEKLRQLNEKAKRKSQELLEKIPQAALRPYLRMIPVKDIPLRVSKFDVTLRDAPLRAVHAVHTILTRMVMFRCLVCNERFPTFHPAYVPPENLDLHLMKHGAGGVAHCNLEVASWVEVPPFPEGDDGVAKKYSGICLCCQNDMDAQATKRSPDGEEVVPIPKRSFLNAMDPCWNFPRQLQWLFQQATVTESCLVALDFMQVNFCTVRRTMMHMFKTNTISFPQETGSFFARMGVMKQFRPGDRVNSIRGPGDESGNASRFPKVWAVESDEQKQRFGQDASGHMVFAATIQEVLVNGDLAVMYYDGDVELGRGVEKTENVTTRVQMPWQPQQVQENLVILLRRNVGYGRILEVLEVRWGLVAKIMQALVRFP